MVSEKIALILLIMVISIMPFVFAAADGEYCNSDNGCDSGNCDWVPAQYTNLCCAAGYDCCIEDYDCKEKGISWNCDESNFKCVKNQFENGYECSVDNQCISGNCVHLVCRPSDPYCGDNECDWGEDSSCPSDCGVTEKGDAGDYCNDNGDCKSEMCSGSMNICCDVWPDCCRTTADCYGGDVCVNYACVEAGGSDGDSDSDADSDSDYEYDDLEPWEVDYSQYTEDDSEFWDRPQGAQCTNEVQCVKGTWCNREKGIDAAYCCPFFRTCCVFDNECKPNFVCNRTYNYCERENAFQNLLKNPSFEDYDDETSWVHYGWVYEEDNASIELQWETYNGERGYYVYDDDTQKAGYLCQKVNVSSGTRYVAKAWVWTEGIEYQSPEGLYTEAESDLSFWLSTKDPDEMMGGGDCETKEGYVHGINNKETWVEYSVSCTPQVSYIYVCMGTSSTYANGNGYFDEIFLSASGKSVRKGACEICTSHIDCSQGFTCNEFSGGIKKCTTGESGTCCGDGTWIPNFVKGTDCCTTDDPNYGCYSDYECRNYKCGEIYEPPSPSGGRCEANSDCADGCCLYTDSYKGAQRDSKGCIKNKEGVVVRAQDSGGGYLRSSICCNGELEIVHEGTDEGVPNCCGEGDCSNGKCVENFCVSYAEGISNLGSAYDLFGRQLTGSPEQAIEDYRKDYVRPMFYGLGGYAAATNNWEDIARYEFEKAQLHMYNAKNLGYFKTLSKGIKYVHTFASVVDAALQAPEQFETLRNLKTAGDLAGNAGTLFSFTDNMTSIYGGMYEADQLASGKVGIPKVDYIIMKGIAVAGSGPMVLLADISNAVFNEEIANASMNYEIEMASINLASAYHAQKIHELIPKSESETRTKEQFQEYFSHAEGFIVMKKIENIMQYRDSIMIYKEKPALSVKVMNFLGAVDIDEYMEEKKQDYDDFMETYDEMHEHLKEIKEEAGFE
ncbi:MAG: hypothetical protein V1672_05835 [Candidatus Diapherotrites archaeon]